VDSKARENLCKLGQSPAPIDAFLRSPGFSRSAYRVPLRLAQTRQKKLRCFGPPEVLSTFRLGSPEVMLYRNIPRVLVTVG